MRYEEPERDKECWSVSESVSNHLSSQEPGLCVAGPPLLLTTLSCSREDNSPGPGPRSQDSTILGRDIRERVTGTIYYGSIKTVFISQTFKQFE